MSTHVRSSIYVIYFGLILLAKVVSRNSWLRPPPVGITGANTIDKKENCKNIIDRGYYMSAHVLLNLLNELEKRYNMRGLSSTVSSIFALV